MRFEKVGMEKLEDLVKTRIQVLRAANKLDGSADMGQTEQESRTYYEKSLEDGSHVAYLVYDGDLIIGTGGISFYQVMPTYHNPTGMKAYIMNMYTDPEYRRKGIAMRTLDLLVQDCLLYTSRTSLSVFRGGLPAGAPDCPYAFQTVKWHIAAICQSSFLRTVRSVFSGEKVLTYPFPRNAARNRL